MKKISKHSLFILCLCFSLLLIYISVSCRTQDFPENKKEQAAQNEVPKTAEEQKPAIADENTERNGVNSEEINPELLEHKPNELGEAMILMYHEIGHPEAEWVRTPENFRRDLENLYEQGYRAVSLTDLVRGNIDIPAGTSPVVFTFDDGNKGNFYYGDSGGELEPAPDCAVAIMENFHQEKPDFGLAATFFIYYPNPFRETQQVEKKLKYLVSKGFEIGNHTYSHANLSKLGPAGIQRELAQHLQKTQEYLAGYPVSSLALPYGAYPAENPGLLLEGSCEGIAYKNEAVLLVGSNPCVSPFHQKFDISRLPRIRASEIKTDGVGLYDWLAYFRQHPHKRYISDGDPRYLTAPESWSELLNEAGLGSMETHFYAD